MAQNTEIKATNNELKSNEYGAQNRNPWTRNGDTLFEGNGSKVTLTDGGMYDALEDASYMIGTSKYERTNVFDDLGLDVRKASSAEQVLDLAGLNFHVKKEEVYTADNAFAGFCTRRYDNGVGGQVFGCVGNKYTPIQNIEAMRFLDALYCEEGFTVETAGEFDNGKTVWVEARLPEQFVVGERVIPYILISNTHDGSSTLKISLTPTRVICRNTLAMATSDANRNFSVTHTASAKSQIDEAREILTRYGIYMNALNTKMEQYKSLEFTEDNVDAIFRCLFMPSKTAGEKKVAMLAEERRRCREIYDNAPDLQGYEHSAFRIMSAVSDYATHKQDKAKRENIFKTMLTASNSVPLMDTAQNLLDTVYAERANVKVAITAK